MSRCVGGRLFIKCPSHSRSIFFWILQICFFPCERSVCALRATSAAAVVATTHPSDSAGAATSGERARNSGKSVLLSIVVPKQYYSRVPKDHVSPRYQ